MAKAESKPVGTPAAVRTSAFISGSEATNDNFSNAVDASSHSIHHSDMQQSTSTNYGDDGNHNALYRKSQQVTKELMVNAAKVRLKAFEDKPYAEFQVGKAQIPQISLLRLPLELRDKIWRLAVRHRKVIKPKQLQPMSCKFAHGLTLKDPNAPSHCYDHFVPAEPPLTVVAMSLTCHQIYDEVIGGNIFYKYNTFEFGNFEVMITYLFAIMPARMLSIRSITCHWHWWPSYIQSCGFTVLAACKGLQYLEIKTDHPCPKFEFWPGLDALISIRGLITFELTYESSIGRSIANLQQGIKEEWAGWEITIRNEVTKPRTTQPSVRKIEQARNHAKLNIFGEGRLGPDKKPGIVASRTRAQLKKQSSMTPLGVFEDFASPKYDLEGNLIWHACEVVDRREIAYEDGTGVIELCIKWNESDELSWEALSDLIDQQALGDISNFPSGLDMIKEVLKQEGQKRNFHSLEEEREWVAWKATEIKRRLRKCSRRGRRVKGGRSPLTSQVVHSLGEL